MAEHNPQSGPRSGHQPAVYRADIDGLRAIAIGLVVIFHFELLPIGDAGFIGVDVFFVISGFLITGNIMRDLQAGSFRLTTFYYRRIRRLYPAMVTMLVLYLVVGYFLFLPARFQELTVETILSQLYVVNFYFWQSINYFGLQADNVPLLHMWSLAVEEQFYVFYPLFLLLIHRIFGARVLALLVLTTVLSFFLGWFAAGWKSVAAFYMLPTRAWELTAGGALVLALQTWRPPGWVLNYGGLAGLALIAGALVIYSPVTAVPGWYILLPVTGAVLLLMAGLAPGAATSRLLSQGGMVWLGQISYPLYLFHWPVAIVLRDILPEFTLIWRLAGLGISIVLAWLTFRFVETPLRRRRVLPGARGFLVATSGAVGAMIAAALLGVFSNGQPQRFSPEVLSVLTFADGTSKDFAACAYGAQQSGPFCTLGQKDAVPTSIMFGDSHAAALAGAFDIWQASLNQSTAFAFSSACLPVPLTGPQKCQEFSEAVVQKALSTPEIETVYFVSIWRQPYENGYLFKGEWKSGAAAHAAFNDALLSTIVRLQAANKTVVLVDPLFSAQRNVPETLAKNIAFGRAWETDKLLARHNAEFAGLFEVFERAQAIGAQRISLIDDLCATGLCKTVWQGQPVFTDNNHLGQNMMPYFANVLSEQTP